MSKIIAVNAGSSSLKFQLLEMPAEDVITEGIVERIGIPNSAMTIKFNGKQKFEQDFKDHAEAIEFLLGKLIELKVVASFDEISGVGHRVVHGGEKFTDSILINAEVIKGIEAVSDLAPLHNPANLTGISAFQKALPNVPHVAVFDTAFHQTMKEDAFMYPTPYEWYEKYGVRKYGFHGTSHKFVSTRANEILGGTNNKIIICHIGNGASLSAVKDGKCVETSMGLTPLAGIPMGTRSGDIDPAIVEFICNKEGKTVQEVTSALNKQSGYLGVSCVSSDARDLEDGVAAGNKKCELAFDLQAKAVVDHIAKYYFYMGGCDAICFTAGIGENGVDFRELVLNRLEFAGVKLDKEANNCRGKEQMITTADSKIKAYVIPTNEEVVIARDTVKFGNIK